MNGIAKIAQSRDRPSPTGLNTKIEHTINIIVIQKANLILTISFIYCFTFFLKISNDLSTKIGNCNKIRINPNPRATFMDW